MNEKDKNGHTALMLAAMGGHLPVVEALLGKGADVEAKYMGNTAAYWASEKGHPAVAQALAAHRGA